MKFLTIFTLSLLAVIYICLAFMFIDNTADMLKEGYDIVLLWAGTSVAVVMPIYLIIIFHDTLKKIKQDGE